MKKTICFSIPCLNEEDNIKPMVNAIEDLFKERLQAYNYIIQFIDNNSTDGTRQMIREICSNNKKVRAIFNTRNFPQTSGYYGLLQTFGDCTVVIPCDFQVPVDLVNQAVEKWENGAQIVCFIKKNAQESKMMWKIRQMYYRLANVFSETEIIGNYTGSGLYDKGFLEVCRNIDDSTILFGQVVSSLGSDIEKIEYIHEKRRSGKSKNGFFDLMDIAITRFTGSSNISMRFSVYAGLIIGLLSIIIGVVYLILKLIFWDNFAAGMAPLLIGVFFLGGIQLFFIGLLGEYVMKINKRQMKRPLVVEKERINFIVEE